MFKFHVGIFRQVPIGTSQEDKDEHLVQMQERAAIVQKYYKHISQGLWDVLVKGFVMEGEESTHPPFYGKKDMLKCMSEQDMQGFEPNYLQVVGGYSGGYCGQANLGGPLSVCYLSWTCGTKVSIHELGHCLGLQHASLSTDGNVVEYGDRTTIMSDTPAILGLSSPHIVYLGLADPDSILEVTSTQQVLAAPIEMPMFCTHDGEFQHIIIKKEGFTDFHVSLRMYKGTLYPAGQKDTKPEILYIQEKSRDIHSVRYKPDLDPGDSVLLPNGVTVHYLEYNGTARFNILFDDVIPENKPMPVGFPNKPKVPAINQYTGAWYDVYYTGQGYIVYVKDGVLVVYWYTYNEDNVSRRFFWATGPANEPLNIFTTIKGTINNPAISQPPELVGTCRLYFTSDTTAVFDYNMPEFGRGGVELTPVAFAVDHPHNGIWYQPDRTGEGFTLQVYNYNIVTAMWFSYGPAPGQPTYGSIQIQRWYQCNGIISDSEPYTLTVYESRTGKWLDPDDVGLIPVGTATITPTLDSGGKLILLFNYSINADRVRIEGTYTLKRIF